MCECDAVMTGWEYIVWKFSSVKGQEVKLLNNVDRASHCACDPVWVNTYVVDVRIFAEYP